MAATMLEELLKLPAHQRADLALWEGLRDVEREAEHGMTLELGAELDRRIAEHQADPASALSWEEVRRRLKAGT